MIRFRSFVSPFVLTVTFLISVWTSSVTNAQQPSASVPTSFGTSSDALHRTVKVGDLDIFYREAGPKEAPTLLLLHGFPTSSQMFRNLIPALSDRYHVIAPDYPGFGHSSMSAHDKFLYTFDNIAKVMEEFTQKIGL
jgi:alpha-beta hydrolase superfamily lysophospholipase